MAYQVLARKYRPLLFSDVAGQDHVTRTLENALNQQRIAHGYIFSGHRGIGKTTIARILASALNCQYPIGSPERPTAEPCLICDSCVEIRQGNAVDVLEIDAATNRGIDEIRELRDAARYRPSRDKFKIIILDEAHQITDAAFNALLKTLEEPPDHIVFMMATTEPENIPQTIRSRCQHFSFHAVKLDDIITELSGIATKEGIIADEAALALLAEAGDGSMRDALSIMDQAIASAPTVDGKPALDATQIRDLMGAVPNTVFEQILEAVSQNQSAEVLTIAARLLDAGNSPAQLARHFVRYLRNTVMAKIANLTPDNANSDLLQISPEERKRAARSAMLFTEEELTRFLQMMLRTFDDLGFRQEQRFHLELGLLKLVHLQRLLPLEELLSAFPTGASTPRPTPRAAASVSAPAPAPPHPQTPPPVPPTIPSSSRPERNEADPSSSRPERSEVERSASPPRATVAPQSISPFGNDSARKTPSASTTQPRPPRTEGALAVAEAPITIVGAEPAIVPEPVPIPEPEPAPEPTAASTIHAVETPAITELPPADPESQPKSEVGGEADQLRSAALEALFAAKGQTSAAERLEDADWVIANGELRIQTDINPATLKLLVRAETEQIIKGALRAKDATDLRLVILPADPAVKLSEKKAKPAREGSVQSLAMNHPTVQQAQKLFNAEVTNVRDLRK
ncbi:DNA polymerase III subunit gamma/tau [Terriglobus saanensis]|nr:DNA polymerase III subunit gamma/tau [Terriglobus saanensis]